MSHYTQYKRNEDVKEMIKQKDPTHAYNGNLSIFDSFWDEVKDLDAPNIVSCKKWTEKDESILKQFRMNGCHNITRCYVMRHAEKRKMQLFTGQVEALLPTNKLKVLGTSLQNV